MKTITFFVCTDEPVAKEIAHKYLSKEKVPYMFMVDSITYDQATKAIESTTDGRWLIWSNEHDAWWAPNERGYTRSRKAAGRYSYSRALEIVRRANCRNGDKPFEAMVEDVDDDEVAIEMGRA